MNKQKILFQKFQKKYLFCQKSFFDFLYWRSTKNINSLLIGETKNFAQKNFLKPLHQEKMTFYQYWKSSESKKIQNIFENCPKKFKKTDSFYLKKKNFYNTSKKSFLPLAQKRVSNVPNKKFHLLFLKKRKQQSLSIFFIRVFFLRMKKNENKNFKNESFLPKNSSYELSQNLQFSKSLKIGEFFPKKKNFIQYWIFPFLGVFFFFSQNSTGLVNQISPKSVFEMSEDGNNAHIPFWDRAQKNSSQFRERQKNIVKKKGKKFICIEPNPILEFSFAQKNLTEKIFLKNCQEAEYIEFYKFYTKLFINNLSLYPFLEKEKKVEEKIYLTQNLFLLRNLQKKLETKRNSFNWKWFSLNSNFLMNPFIKKSKGAYTPSEKVYMSKAPESQTLFLPFFGGESPSQKVFEVPQKAEFFMKNSLISEKTFSFRPVFFAGVRKKEFFSPLQKKSSGEKNSFFQEVENIFQKRIKNEKKQFFLLNSMSFEKKQKRKEGFSKDQKIFYSPLFDYSKSLFLLEKLKENFSLSFSSNISSHPLSGLLAGQKEELFFYNSFLPTFSRYKNKTKLQSNETNNFLQGENQKKENIKKLFLFREKKTEKNLFFLKNWAKTQKLTLFIQSQQKKIIDFSALLTKSKKRDQNYLFQTKNTFIKKNTADLINLINLDCLYFQKLFKKLKNKQLQRKPKNEILFSKKQNNEFLFSKPLSQNPPSGNISNAKGIVEGGVDFLSAHNSPDHNFQKGVMVDVRIAAGSPLSVMRSQNSKRGGGVHKTQPQRKFCQSFLKVKRSQNERVVGQKGNYLYLKKQTFDFFTFSHYNKNYKKFLNFISLPKKVSKANQKNEKLKNSFFLNIKGLDKKEKRNMFYSSPFSLKRFHSLLFHREKLFKTILPFSLSAKNRIYRRPAESLTSSRPGSSTLSHTSPLCGHCPQDNENKKRNFTNSVENILFTKAFKEKNFCFFKDCFLDKDKFIFHSSIPISFHFLQKEQSSKLHTKNYFSFFSGEHTKEKKPLNLNTNFSIPQKMENSIFQYSLIKKDSFSFQLAKSNFFENFQEKLFVNWKESFFGNISKFENFQKSFIYAMRAEKSQFQKALLFVQGAENKNQIFKNFSFYNNRSLKSRQKEKTVYEISKNKESFSSFPRFFFLKYKKKFSFKQYEKIFMERKWSSNKKETFSTFSGFFKKQQKFEKVFLSFFSPLKNEKNHSFLNIEKKNKHKTYCFNKKTEKDLLFLKNLSFLLKKPQFFSHHFFFSTNKKTFGFDIKEKKVFSSLNSSFKTSHLSPEFILKRDGFLFISSKSNKKNLNYQRLEKEKVFQKKRRLKKEKLETRRRKKRKRFYPRPLWLRMNLYKKFLKTRHSQKLFSFSTFSQKFKENNLSKSLFSLQKKKTNFESFYPFVSQNRKALKNNGRWFRPLCGEKEKKTLNRYFLKKFKNKRNIFSGQKKISSDFINLYSSSVFFKKQNLNFQKKTYQKNSRKNNSFFNHQSFPSNHKREKGLCTQGSGLGNLPLSTFKNPSTPLSLWGEICMPDSIFRQGVFDYLLPAENLGEEIGTEKVSKNMNSYKISNEIFIEFLKLSWKSSMFQNNFKPYTEKIIENFQKIQSVESKKISFHFFDLVKQKNFLFFFHDFPVFSDQRQNNFVLQKSVLQKFSWYSSIQNSFSSTQNSFHSKLEWKGKEEKYSEYNRILYSRISEVLKKFKFSENMTNESFFESFKVQRRKNEKIFSESKNSFFTKTALFFEKFQVPSQSVIPAFSLFSSLFNDFSIKPTGDIPTLRSMWAFQKTNSSHFIDRNAIQNLWAFKKRNATYSSFKGTKKIMNFLRRYNGFEKFKTPEQFAFADVVKINEFSLMEQQKKVNKKNLFSSVQKDVPKNGGEGSKKQNFYKFYTTFSKDGKIKQNLLDRMTLQKFQNIEKKYSLFGIQSLKQNSKISYRYFKFHLSPLNKSQMKFSFAPVFFAGAPEGPGQKKSSGANTFPFKKEVFDSSFLEIQQNSFGKLAPLCFNKGIPSGFEFVDAHGKISPVFSQKLLKNKNIQNSAKSSLNFWWAQQPFQNFDFLGTSQFKIFQNFSTKNIFQNGKNEIFSNIFFEKYSKAHILEKEKFSSFLSNFSSLFKGNFFSLSLFEGKESGFFLFSALFFHFSIFYALFKIPEIRSVFKFTFLIFSKFWKSFFLLFFSIYNIFKKYTKNGYILLKNTSSFTEKKTVFSQIGNSFSTAASFKKGTAGATLAYQQRRSVYVGENFFSSRECMNKIDFIPYIFMNTFLKRKSDFIFLSFLQKGQIKKIKKNKTNFDSFVFEFFPRFFFFEPLQNNERFFYGSTEQNKAKKDFIQNFSKRDKKLSLLKINFYNRNFLSFFKFLKNKNDFVISQKKYSQKIEKSFVSVSKIEKILSQFALSFLVFGKYILFIPYQIFKTASLFLTKIFEIIESIFYAFYKFLEKPAEFMIEFIAFVFLIEWSSDLVSYFPESIESSMWKSSVKLLRPVRTGTFFLSFGIFFFSPVVRSFSKGYQVSVQPSLSFSVFSPFQFLISTGFLNFSNFVAYVLEKRLLFVFEHFPSVLLMPDIDILVRQRKGIIFWDIWAEILLKAAEKYNVNLPSFVTLKEEQELFIEKLVRDSEFFESFQRENLQKTNLFIFTNRKKNSLKIFSFFHQLTPASSMKSNFEGLTKSHQEGSAPLAQVDQNFVIGNRPKSFFDFCFGLQAQSSFDSYFFTQKKLQLFTITNLLSQSALHQKGSTSLLASLQKQKFFLNFSNVQNLTLHPFIKKEIKNSFNFFPFFDNLLLFQTLEQVSDVSTSNSFFLDTGEKTTSFRGKKDRWQKDQYATFQSLETDFFLDIYPPKSLKHVHFLKYYEPAQYTLGSLICQIYSGVFSKQISKNILVIGESGRAKTFFLQALAGETEMKIITENASRYAMVQRGVAVGMKYLRDVFDALALQTPCFFVMEDLHVIGSKRPFMISENENINSQSSFAREQQEVHETNQMIYQSSRHSISDFRRPYKGDYSMTIPTNFFLQTFYLPFFSSRKNSRNSASYSHITDSNRGDSFFYSIQKAHQFQNSQFFGGNFSSNFSLSSPLPIDSLNASFQNSEKNTNAFESFSSKKNIKKIQSFLQFSKEQIFAPPATSPFTVLMMKEQKKLKAKKIVQETSWGGLSADQILFYQKESSSIRAKIAAFAEKTMNLSHGKFDMITDFLVILDSVRSNRGFVVFGTTHKPSSLDPALRRPGRFDETLSLSRNPTFLNRFEIFKMNFENFVSTFDFFDSSILTENFSEIDLFDILSQTKLSFLHNYKFENTLTGKKQIYSQISPTKAFYALLKSPLFEDFYTQKQFKVLSSLHKQKEKIHPFFFAGATPGPGQKKRSSKKDFSLRNSNFFLPALPAFPYLESSLNSAMEQSVQTKDYQKTGFESQKYTLLPKGPSHLLSLAYTKIGIFLAESNLLYNPNSFIPLYLDIEKNSSNRSNFIQFYGNVFYDSKKQRNVQLMVFLSGKIAEFFSSSPINKNLFSTKFEKEKIHPFFFAGAPEGPGQKKSSGKKENFRSGIFNISSNFKSPMLFEKPQFFFDTKFGVFQSSFENFQKSKNEKYKKSFWLHSSNPSFGEKERMPTKMNSYEKNSQMYMGVNFFEHLKNQKNCSWTVFGNEENWRSGTPFLFSLIQKRFLFTKNLLLSKIFFFENMDQRRKPPSPPGSSILMPSKKYENFKRTETDFFQKSYFSIREKIQMHQKQRFLKQLYNVPVQVYFRSELRKNHKTLFSSSFQEFASLDLFVQKSSSSSFYYKKYIQVRHRFSHSNQWWNGMFPEHTRETTYLSDVDWRTMFFSSNETLHSSSKMKGEIKKQQKDRNKAEISIKSSNETFEFLMDFPDAEQYYNPRNRRWFFKSNPHYGVFDSPILIGEEEKKLKGEFFKNSTFWNLFEKDLQYEIFSHFLMESFYQSFSYFEKKREMLDFFVFHFLCKGFLKEFDFLTTFSRF